jgi:hypothetical protein
VKRKKQRKKHPIIENPAETVAENGVSRLAASSLRKRATKEPFL